MPAQTMVDRWVDRLLKSSGGWSAVVVAVGLVAGLGISYAIMFAVGGTKVVAATPFYLVVMIGAVRFGYAGAVSTSLLGSILAGPLMPFDAISGTPQPLSMWLSRSATLFMVALTTTVLIERVRSGHSRELTLVEKERDLAMGKAAVVSTVAHEFRSPLTVINGVARMLEKEDAIPEQFEPLFQGLMESTDRLIDLVTTMGSVLDGREGTAFLRTETAVTRELLNTMLTRVPARGATSRVTLKVEPDAEFVQTDKELLEQLLRHVVENALKFSDPEQPVEIDASREGDFLSFKVLDRGPGIDGGLLSFDPFKQGDQSISREHDGLGLGLFASVRLAQMLGGSLSVSPRRGGGSVVRILIASCLPGAATP